MITIAVDDMLSIAQQIRDMLSEIDPLGSHYAVDKHEDLLSLAAEKNPDIIWLDIEMPGMNGLEAAVEVKKLSSGTNIVFVTGFPEYAVDAFGMHVSGYVLKPVTEERLRSEISELRNQLKENADNDKLLRIQCFGHFEVFSNNIAVKFSRSLSKEVLAYLVDRRGASCTMPEICSVIWEDRVVDKNLKSQCRVIMASLKKDLDAVGAGDVLVKNWNTWGVDTSKVRCDYYDFLKNDSSGVNAFRGEYMTQYAWAEMTVGRLFDITDKEADK